MAPRTSGCRRRKGGVVVEGAAGAVVGREAPGHLGWG